jgi:hypothetical protein
MDGESKVPWKLSIHYIDFNVDVIAFNLQFHPSHTQ